MSSILKYLSFFGLFSFVFSSTVTPSASKILEEKFASEKASIVRLYRSLLKSDVKSAVDGLLLSIGPGDLMREFEKDNSDDWFLALFWYSLSHPIDFFLLSYEGNFWVFLKNLEPEKKCMFGEKIITSLKQYILRNLVPHQEKSHEIINSAQSLYSSRFSPIISFIANDLPKELEYHEYHKMLEMRESFSFFHLMVEHDPYTLFGGELRKFLHTTEPNQKQASFNSLLYITYYISHDVSTLYGLKWIAHQPPKVFLYFFYFAYFDHILFSKQEDYTLNNYFITVEVGYGQFIKRIKKFLNEPEDKQILQSVINP